MSDASNIEIINAMSSTRIDVEPAIVGFEKSSEEQSKSL